jgi:uncharacterized membrane protein YedE/YeeE
MKRDIAAAISGLVFSLGLVVSGMVNPSKVLNFLDLFGAWDPSLALVMAGGVTVSFIGFRLLRGRTAPLFERRFHWPTRQDLNLRLVGGAALFGLGWGLVGLCPGPAVAALAIEPINAALFVGGAILGMVGLRYALRA